MKKICFYLMVISQIFAQTTIDTLSVTIYPEFSYPGVAIEYKFDKFGSDEIGFPVSSDIDSVLYTVSGDGLEFEQILKTNENSFQAINQDGNHTIILGVQIPFASEDFTVNAEGFSLERVRDQNGLTFFQGIINDFSESSSTEINLSYYNPHGNTSIEYAANISTQDSVVQPPPTASDRFVRYPFITWEPMIAFLLLSIILVVIFEFQRIRDE